MSGRTNYPEDTEDKFYIECGYYEKPLSEIFEKAKEKWPGITLEEILISHEHRHVECLGYDLYDAADYQDYYIISRSH